MIPHNDPEFPPAQTCPVCGQPYRQLDLPLSAALDWVETLHETLDTLHSTLHNLKAALEEVMP